jgi:hypothetical protein
MYTWIAVITEVLIYNLSDVIYRGKAEGLDTYCVTFDHLVPVDDKDPETLQITIFETEYDNTAYANKHYIGLINPEDYTPHTNRVFATYRCCEWRRGTTDRSRINFEVQLHDTPPSEVAQFLAESDLITKRPDN